MYGPGSKLLGRGVRDQGETKSDRATAFFVPARGIERIANMLNPHGSLALGDCPRGRRAPARSIWERGVQRHCRWDTRSEGPLSRGVLDPHKVLCEGCLKTKHTALTTAFALCCFQRSADVWTTLAFEGRDPRGRHADRPRFPRLSKHLRTMRNQLSRKGAGWVGPRAVVPKSDVVLKSYC